MARHTKRAWESSGNGYVTFDTSVSSAAIEVARNPNTSASDRQDYARQVNRSARSTYEGIKRSRNIRK